ncbi:hypothetical protein F5B20DRAFT_581706 [Whalleya microplaca]|nr:hypothetical protein F5B20DRAFT_581706 [Whalleya microplaca]
MPSRRVPVTKSQEAFQSAAKATSYQQNVLWRGSGIADHEDNEKAAGSAVIVTWNLAPIHAWGEGDQGVNKSFIPFWDNEEDFTNVSDDGNSDDGNGDDGNGDDSHIGDNDGDDAGVSCAICQDVRKTPDPPVILPCKHAFHAGCIQRWVGRQRTQTCPFCRRVLMFPGCEHSLNRSLLFAGQDLSQEDILWKHSKFCLRCSFDHSELNFVLNSFWLIYVPKFEGSIEYELVTSEVIYRRHRMEDQDSMPLSEHIAGMASYALTRAGESTQSTSLRAEALTYMSIAINEYCEYVETRKPWAKSCSGRSLSQRDIPWCKRFFQDWNIAMTNVLWDSGEVIDAPGDKEEELV